MGRYNIFQNWDLSEVEKCFHFQRKFFWKIEHWKKKYTYKKKSPLICFILQNNITFITESSKLPEYFFFKWKDQSLTYFVFHPSIYSKNNSESFSRTAEYARFFSGFFHLLSVSPPTHCWPSPLPAPLSPSYLRRYNVPQGDCLWNFPLPKLPFPSFPDKPNLHLSLPFPNRCDLTFPTFPVHAYLIPASFPCIFLLPGPTTHTHLVIFLQATLLAPTSSAGHGQLVATTGCEFHVNGVQLELCTWTWYEWGPG